ncbi:hypothetical protein J6590_017449, partial [Homalodisca vitripennis]
MKLSALARQCRTSRLSRSPRRAVEPGLFTLPFPGNAALETCAPPAVTPRELHDRDLYRLLFEQRDGSLFLFLQRGTNHRRTGVAVLP